WPDPAKFELLDDGVQYPDNVWYGALAEGKLPVMLEGFMSHDLGHMTEMLQPEIMRQTRRYAAVAVSLLASKKNRMHDHLLGIRNMIMSELLSPPNPSNADLIRETIPEWFSPGGPASLAERR